MYHLRKEKLLQKMFSSVKLGRKPIFALAVAGALLLQLSGDTPLKECAALKLTVKKKNLGRKEAMAAATAVAAAGIAGYRHLYNGEKSRGGLAMEDSSIGHVGHKVPGEYGAPVHHGIDVEGLYFDLSAPESTMAAKSMEPAESTEPAEVEVKAETSAPENSDPSGTLAEMDATAAKV